MKHLVLTALLLLTGAAHAQSLPPHLDGSYKMELTIGEHLFVDHMELKGKNGLLYVHGYQGNIVGTITVPGVFSSPLNGQGQCSPEKSSCEFNFEILATENGQSYKVFYHAELTPDAYKKSLCGETPVLKGTASLENGQIMGNFTAIRQ